MRILRLICPYILAVAGAIAVFIGGAYTGFRFSSDMFLSRKLGEDMVVRLVMSTALLSQLDKNDVESVHASLVLEQDSDLLGLNNLAPYVPADTAKTACRLFRRIAKLRADGYEKYSNVAKGINPDPRVSESVARALNNPQVCTATDG